MSESFLVFKDFADIRLREQYSLDNTITVETFASIVGLPYHFKEEVRCQVEREGRVCQEPHKHGWLGRRKDGKEALIGNECGSKYFQASETFRAERARAAEADRIESHISALSQLLQDREGVERRLTAASQRYKEVLEIRRDMQANLPGEIMISLSGMVKTGNRTVGVEAQYLIDVDDQGREKKEWRRYDLGAVQGLGLWTDLSDIPALIEASRKALDQAHVSRKEKESSLRKWRESLEHIPLFEQRLASLESSAKEFQTPSNIALLAYLVRNQTRQLEVMTLVLREQGVQNRTKSKAQEVLNQSNEQIRAASRGLNIRIP